MDELLKLIPAIFKQNGLVGLICIFLLWDRIYRPHKARKSEESERERKRASGEWVSWSDLKKKLDFLEKIIQDHLEKEAQEDVRMAKMETTIEFNGKEIQESKEDIKNIFKILGEIKNLIIQIQGQSH